MSTTTHQVALFEEGFMLVGVDLEDIEELGEQEVWEAIQQHPFVLSKGAPVVIVYEDEDGEIEAYGDRELVSAVTQMNFKDINWGHELTLEWTEDEEDEDEEEFEDVEEDDEDDEDEDEDEEESYLEEGG